MAEIKPKHSPIGASSMYRWAACPGSVKLSEGLENKASVYAQEGSAAHEMVGLALERALAESKPAREVLEKAMTALYMYTDYIERMKGDNPIHIEHSFDMGDTFEGLYGTADCVIFDTQTRTLRVIDYKNGEGVPVEVENNLQLQYYALGAMTTLPYQPVDVEMTIVQPRCYHPAGPIRSWKVSAIHFIDFRADLIDAAKATLNPKAKLKDGKHCMFCRAKTKCPMKHESATKQASRDFLKYNDPKNDFEKVKML